MTVTKTPSRFGYASGLACRECGQTYDLGAQYACSQCFGPLEVGYDLPQLTREVIEAGPQTIWRRAGVPPPPPHAAGAPPNPPPGPPLARAPHPPRAPGRRASPGEA